MSSIASSASPATPNPETASAMPMHATLGEPAVSSPRPSVRSISSARSAPIPQFPGDYMLTSSAPSPTPSVAVSVKSSTSAKTSSGGFRANAGGQTFLVTPSREELRQQFDQLHWHSQELADSVRWLKRHYIQRTVLEYWDHQHVDHDDIDAFLNDVDTRLQPNFDLLHGEQAALMGPLLPRPAQERAMVDAPPRPEKKKRSNKLKAKMITPDASATPPAHSTEPTSDEQAVPTTPNSVRPRSFQSFRAAEAAAMATLPVIGAPADETDSSSLSGESHAHFDSDSPDVDTPPSSSASRSSSPVPSFHGPAPPTALPYQGIIGLTPREKKPKHSELDLENVKWHMGKPYDKRRRGPIERWCRGGQDPIVAKQDAEQEEQRAQLKLEQEQRWEAHVAAKHCCECGWNRINGPRAQGSDPHTLRITPEGEQVKPGDSAVMCPRCTSKLVASSPPSSASSIANTRCESVSPASIPLAPLPPSPVPSQVSRAPSAASGSRVQSAMAAFNALSRQPSMVSIPAIPGTYSAAVPSASSVRPLASRQSTPRPPLA
ncbi:hypothetical protein BKA62DRAFT_829090 [Auriculariales sp. MPI-PUGE-AT-0066]|nr:hypothetical protein BKA62DRAFT_829090 [Auriculariales sp. MPI-PUGE-AT-0066]